MQSNYSPFMRVIASIILITFIMLILEPTAAAAQTLLNGESQPTKTETVPKSTATQTFETATLPDTFQKLENTVRQLQAHLADD